MPIPEPITITRVIILIGQTCVICLPGVWEGQSDPPELSGEEVLPKRTIKMILYQESGTDLDWQLTVQ